jgi:hypothetical protein
MTEFKGGIDYIPRTIQKGKNGYVKWRKDIA